MPFVDQTSRTVDATAGSFKKEETLADPLIKNVCADIQKKRPQERFFSTSSVRKNQLSCSVEMTCSSVFIIQKG